MVNESATVERTEDPDSVSVGILPERE